MAATAAGLSIWCGGCTSETLRTTSLPSNAAAVVHGQPYYLPKVLIPISIVGTKNKPGGGGSQSAAATSGTSATSSATNTNSVNVTVNNAPKPDGSADKPPEPPYQIIVKVGAPKFVPDPSQRYFLEYIESAFTDDKFTIRVDQDGLLQTTEAKSKDRTGDIIAKVVDLAAAAAKLPFALEVPLAGPRAAPPPPEEAPPPPPPCPLGEVSADLLVDPAHPGESATDPGLVTAVTKFLAPLKISIVKVPSTSTAAVPPPNVEGDDKTGVIFRASEPYRISIEVDPTAAPTCNLPSYVGNAMVMAPNEGPTFRVDVSRAALVEKRVNLLVQNGMLTGVDIEKPSEVLAGITLPVDILNKIASIPGQLLTFRIEQVKSESSLTAEQANLIAKQIELSRQEQLLKAQGNPSTP